MKKIDLKYIQKFFKKKHFTKVESKHLTRDWSIFITIFISAIVFVIILNIYIYIQIQKGNIFIVEKEDINTTININEERLESTLKKYKGKIEKFENYKRDSSNISNIN